MSATVTHILGPAALADALAELSFKDGSSVVALSLPQARVLAYASMGRKTTTPMHSAAQACYRLALVDHDITKPGVYTLTKKGTSLVRKAAASVKVAEAGIVLEVTPAAAKATDAKRFSHTSCSHERTPAARAACRKAHAKA